MHTLPVRGGKVNLLKKCQDNAEQKQFKDAAKKTMECMSKQGTPILDLHSGSAEVCLRKEKKKNKSILFISQGQNSKSTATDLFFQIIPSMI